LRNAGSPNRGRSHGTPSRGITALLVWVLFASDVFAQRPTATPDPATEAYGHLLDAFIDLCLNRFPNEATFAAGAKARQLQPMTAGMVKQYLHDDPGRGWSGTMPSGSYVVTIENPPYYACAVRQIQKPMPVFAITFQLAVAAWVANSAIVGLQTESPMRQTDNGMTINALMLFVPDSNGRPKQAFMYIVTDYTDGRAEIRLVHQFPPS
jgi:hypothetical protein